MNQDNGENGGKHRVRRIISWGGGIVAAVIIAIFVDAFTPLGERISEYLFPPPEVIPPDTNIISVIDGDNKNLNEGDSTYSTYVKFMFNGTDDKQISGFKCSLQDQEFVPCTSPEPKGGLKPGYNVFKVKAIDSDLAEDATPDVFTLNVHTSAVVEGFIYQEIDRPVPRSKVELNKTQNVWTDAIGKFLFQRVPQGFHEYWVYDTSNNPLAGPLTFFISEGELIKNLERIQLDLIQPEFQQTYAGPTTATPTTATSTNATSTTATSDPPPAPPTTLPFSPPTTLELSPNMTASQINTCIGEDEICLTHEAVFVRDPSIHNVTVQVTGPQQSLSDIERVTYELHPSFKPNIVTRYSSEDNFALSFSAWGQFTLKATVYFKEGEVKDLFREISFPTSGSPIKG